MRSFLSKANILGICMALILGVLSNLMLLQWGIFREVDICHIYICCLFNLLRCG